MTCNMSADEMADKAAERELLEIEIGHLEMAVIDRAEDMTYYARCINYEANKPKPDTVKICRLEMEFERAERERDIYQDRLDVAITRLAYEF